MLLLLSGFWGSHVAAMPISLESVLVDEAGQRVEGATIRAYYPDAATVTLGQATSNSLGYFVIDGLARENALLEITASGYRMLTVPVHLVRPSADEYATLEPIVLDPENPAEVRFVFAGDTSYGRRFFDPGLDSRVKLTSIPAPVADAYIDTSNPLPGTIALHQFVKHMMAPADFTALNFESPVTADPSTPHPDKTFAFFSLPGSLPALTDLGVDYVSLGNNHVYDYLEAGLADTFTAFDALPLGHSGAGANEADAFASFQTTIAGTDYQLFSMSSVSGSQFAPGLTYFADDSNNKGGSADLRDDASVTAAIGGAAVSGDVVIASLHTGREYLFSPSDFARERMNLAVAAGADLVIGHHPHTVQGFSFQSGALVVESLGNFLFDQSRLETLLGLVAQIDLQGATASRVRALPIYLEDFRPRRLIGAQGDRLLRRIAEESPNAVVVPFQHQAWVQQDTTALSRQTQAVTIDVTLDGAGNGVLDLRELMADDGSPIATASALATLQSSTALNARLGRDLMDGHGDFEDWDVDDDRGDLDSYAPRWSIPSSSGVCGDDPNRGAFALCSMRSSSNISDSTPSFRNRTRIRGANEFGQANKDLTLLGYVRADNAGAVVINSRYFASSSRDDGSVAEFGEETAFSSVGGTFDWQLFHADLNLPPDPTDPVIDEDNFTTEAPRSMRLFIRHSPPNNGDGVVAFDDVVIINWESARALAADVPQQYIDPLQPRLHPLEFLKLTDGPANQSVTMTMTFDRLVPTAVVGINVAGSRPLLFSDGFEQPL